MSEFINRKLFIAATKSLYCETCNHRTDCLICNVGHMIRKIKNFPSADVAPIVHGHWKWVHRLESYECSACCGEALCDDWGDEQLTDYCPHCGAKMGESEGEENEV